MSAFDSHKFHEDINIARRGYMLLDEHKNNLRTTA